LTRQARSIPGLAESARREESSDSAPFRRDFGEISEFFKDARGRVRLLSAAPFGRRTTVRATGARGGAAGREAGAVSGCRHRTGAAPLRGLQEGGVVRKRSVTSIETHQVVVVRRRAGAAPGWCPACLKEVGMVHLEEAALLAGVSLREICRRAGADEVHLVETADGGLVCTNSLLNKAGSVGLNSDGADTLSPPAADLSDAADH
jgi:hypothetical protein